MKKVFSAVLVFVLLSGGVGYWTLRQFDKTVRSELIARVSEKTGREMTIDGEITSHFFFSPSIRINNMKIPFSCRSERFCTLKIGLLTAELKFLPLLNRRAEINRLTANDVSVDVDGDRFFSVRADTAEALVGKDKITVRVQGSEKTFDLAADIEKKTSDTYAFTLKAAGADFSLNASGNVAEPFLKTRGQAGLSLKLNNAALLNPRFPALENVAVDAKTQFDQNKFSVSGFEINAGTAQTALVSLKGAVDAFSPLSARFHAEVNAPDMGTVKGLPSMPNTTFSADVDLKDGFVLDDLKMTVGDSDLSGRIVRQTGNDIRILAGLHSNRFRLADGMGKIVYSLAGLFPASKGKKDKVFSADPFPFEKLKAAVIDIAFSTDHFVGSNGTDLGKTEFNASMRDGVFSVPDFKLADYVRAQVLFDASKQPADLKMALKAEKLPLVLFFAQNGVERGNLSASVQLAGQGVSEAQTAASLNGRVFVNMRDLYLKSVQFLPPELSFLFPADENRPLEIQCAVVNIPVQSGLLSSRKKVALQSNIADLQLGGDVNLKDETLNLKLGISPQSDGVLKSVLNSADINGTLVKPKIGLNAEKMLDKALSVGMAFFMGGREAAEEMVRQEKLKNVCATALAEGQ